MRRRRADVVVAAVAVAVLLVGVLWSFQATQRPTTTMNGAMMDSMMDGGMSYGTDPIVYVLGALLIAVVVAGGYLLVREEMTAPNGANEGQARADPEPEPTNSAEATGDEPTADTPERELLQYLPEDERRVLEPVLDSPGVTQIEVRDRSSFSKSKVSQTLSALEQRGLIYKEKQGRTFRVYPGDGLDAEP